MHQGSYGYRRFKSTFVVLATMGIAVGLAACQADAWGEAPPPPTAVDAKQASTESCIGAATPAASQADPTKYAECTGTKGGKGRCVPESSLGDFKGIFESASCASGEACAPEPVVKEGTSLKLKTCTVMNKEGRCFWPLAKPMIQYYDMLKDASKDCDEGMLCAPCNNPVSNEETGVCRAGGGAGGASCAPDAQNAPKSAGPEAASAKCCEGRGQCVPTSVVEGAGARMLSTDSCAADTQLCAPNEILKSVKPTKCTTGLGLVTGICVSKCTMDSPVASLVQGSCPDGDLCAPCRFMPDGACN